MLLKIASLPFAAIFSVSILHLVMWAAVWGSSGAWPGSTCDLTRSFGARSPLCSLATGISGLDRPGSDLLTMFDALAVWGVMAATSAALIVLTLTSSRSTR